ncbi:MAG: orotate phosphoribosyltransferase [Acetobacteraceae bacterium]|nr:orotate phosphoribosyltransferase [Acetobacteraceae bacterium]
MTEAQVLDLFRRTGVLQEGHFQLSSGRHSGRYLQCARVLQHPRAAARLGSALARRLKRALGREAPGERPDLVVGPALGGILVAHEVARALGVRALFCEREGGVMSLRRGFSIGPGERAVVVEDVVTTGGSVEEVLRVVAAAGGRPLAVGALVDRGGGGVRLRGGLPLVALVRLEVESYPPEACPLCAAGVPLEKPGSRPTPRGR